MVVISSLQTNLHHNQFSTNTHHNTNIYTITCKPISPNLIYFHNLIKNFSKTSSSTSNGNFTIKAYIEDSNSFSNFANKVIGSLPVIGLIARIVNGEGGVGSDFIDFAEFRRRVGNKCSVNDSKAFYDFQVRHGKAGEPLYVLLCCWLAAVGAGLLKSEEILEGVARLRISDDIEFEEQTFIQIMNEAREKREKLKSPNPKIPMNIRVEKALDAIYVCSFGRDPIEDEDIELLTVMLIAVFPTVGASEIQRIIKEKAQRIADGTEVFSPEAKPLPKEAALLQMKDLEFLQQKKEK